MWIFVKEGFFSIGCGADSDGYADPSVKMIRGRDYYQLEKLKAAYPEILSDKAIVHTFETDYSYRILLYENELNMLLLDIGQHIDYRNFKDTALEENPTDLTYINFLRKIWEYWYIIKGGFEQRPKKKKKKGKTNVNTKKYRKGKNGGRRRKAIPS